MHRVVVIFLGLVAAVPCGCASLSVKLAARNFSRALKKGDRERVMRASTARLNQAFWARLDPETFRIMVKTFKGGFSGTGTSNGSKTRRRRGSRHKPRVVGLKLKGRQARLSVRVSSFRMDFLMQKTGGQWKVDDLQVSGGGRLLSLRKDASLWLCIQGFYAATVSGSRKELMRYSSSDFNQRGWSKVTDSEVRRTSRSVKLKGSSGGSSGGSGTRFDLRLGKDAARFDVRTTGRQAVFHLVRQAGRWRVDDVELSHTVRSGRTKVGSLKELVAALAALRRFLKALARRDLPRIRAMAGARVNLAVWAKAKREHVVPIRPPKRARLVSWDIEGTRAVLMLADARRPSRRLTAYLAREKGRWVVTELGLERGDDRISLSQAVAIRTVLTSVLRSAMNGRLDQVRQHSSRDLNRRVWDRIRSLGLFKVVLLAGGLNRLLGFKALPGTGLWARLDFIRRASVLAHDLLRGRVSVASAGVLGPKARVRMRVFGRTVTILLVRQSGEWKLDDVIWPVPAGRRSLKNAAGDVLSLLPAR